MTRRTVSASEERDSEDSNRTSPGKTHSERQRYSTLNVGWHNYGPVPSHCTVPCHGHRVGGAARGGPGARFGAGPAPTRPAKPGLFFR
eukprot:761508-Hanusia_phi.AAC.6